MQRDRAIEDIARETRIPVGTLSLLENDRFDALPGDVFVRGFLRAYARALAIPADEIVARHTLSRRGAAVAGWPSNSFAKPRSAKRTWSVAIGFVVLLILFTVALTVALRSRDRSLPSQLAARTRTPAALQSKLVSQLTASHEWPRSRVSPRALRAG